MRKHDDHPNNFLKLLDRLPGKNKFFNLIEKYAFLNIKFNYSIWPSFIFLPISLWVKILLDTDGFKFANLERLHTFAESMQAMGGFRYTKDIYTFDQTLLENLIKTPIYEINPLALIRLPEHTLFVDLNGKLIVNNRKISGFYAYYNDEIASERVLEYQTVPHDLRKEMKEYPYKLCIRILWDDDEYNNIFICSIPLKDGKIKDNLHEINLTRKKIGKYHGNKDISIIDINETISIISKILPLLLYLCSEDPDIKDKKCSKIKQVPYYDKDKPKRIFSPSQIRIWEVGKEVAKIIRRNLSECSNKIKISPHLRRAHWHGYYKGKRNSEERELIYKWIPPIYVNPTIESRKNPDQA